MDITFKNVSVLYENKKRDIITAIDDISFSFMDEKINVLVGPSGSGKTSLARCLTGEIIYEGEIMYGEKDLEKIETKDRNISYVNENYTLLPNVNVYDNIAFPLRLNKVDHDEADQTIKEVTKYLDIDFLLTRKTKYLSLGQISRVKLAKCFVKDSDLYIFDESNRNLDEENRNKINRYIKDRLKGKTIIFITHNISEALSIADYIYVMNEGKYRGRYTPIEFLESNDEVVQNLLSEIKNEKKKLF